MMAATTLRAIRGYHHWSIKKAFIATMILCVLYGMTDEIHQCFVPGRSPEWRDWIADAVGSLAGILVWLLWERIALDPPTYFKRRRNLETDQSRLA
jgi:VanZ family protein